MNPKNRHSSTIVLLGVCVLLTGHAVSQTGVPTTPGGRRAAGTERQRKALVTTTLDLNADGVIDENEITHAGASLKKLDKNGDGMLTADEYAKPQPGSRPVASTDSNTGSPPPITPAVSKPDIGSQPNVLIIVADDLGWNGVGFHHAGAPTPNLNRLAAEGMELQRFYTYPVCSPTRASLLTGQMSRRFGIVDPLGPRQTGLPKGVATMPAAFRKAGYQTSLIGKWHLGTDNPPLQCGFDHFYGFLGPQIDYFTHVGQRGTTDWQRNGKTIEEFGYSTYLLADEAIRQVKQRDSKRPFFMELAFNAPHVPLAAPAELMAKHLQDGGVYSAVIEAMDIAIGRVLSALDEQGLRDNTLVVFFSDNGGAQRFSSNAPLSRGKDTICEGGIRTPCVIRWPGKIPAATKSQQPVSVHDLFPTLAAASKLTLAAVPPLDGSSQWDALISGKTPPRKPFLIASHEIALIDGDWKLIEWENGSQSLFNLKTDISETQDELSKQPDLAKQLAARLANMKRDLPAAPARQPRR